MQGIRPQTQNRQVNPNYNRNWSNLHDGVLVTVAPNVMTIITPTIRWRGKEGIKLLSLSTRFTTFCRLIENFLSLGTPSVFRPKKLQCSSNLFSGRWNERKKFLYTSLLRGDWDEKQIAVFRSLLFKHQHNPLPLFFTGKWFQRSTYSHSFYYISFSFFRKHEYEDFTAEENQF